MWHEPLPPGRSPLPRGPVRPRRAGARRAGPLREAPQGLRQLCGGSTCAVRGRGTARVVGRSSAAHGDARPGAGRRTHHPAGARRTAGAGPSAAGAGTGAQVAAAAACLGAQPPPRQRRRRPLFVPFATATAAAALVVASLFAVQANRTQDELDAQKAQASEIAHVLQAADAAATRGQDAQGRTIGVIASASEGRAVVTLSGYSAPPSGRVRQLWLMRPNEQPRSLGLFAADTPLVATGLDKSATSLAVTVEPDGGSPQPTTQPVVQLALKSVGFGE